VINSEKIKTMVLGANRVPQKITTGIGTKEKENVDHFTISRKYTSLLTWILRKKIKPDELENSQTSRVRTKSAEAKQLNYKQNLQTHMFSSMLSGVISES
jgi:hypothetical protein